MKYAVVKLAGSQYKVSEGEKLEVQGFWGKKEENFALKEVLLFVDGEKTLVGKPNLEGFEVQAKILEQKLGKKVIVAKFKAKTGYRRRNGFRAEKTILLIEKILLP